MTLVPPDSQNSTLQLEDEKKTTHVTLASLTSSPRFYFSRFSWLYQSTPLSVNKRREVNISVMLQMFHVASVFYQVYIGFFQANILSICRLPYDQGNLKYLRSSPLPVSGFEI